MEPGKTVFVLGAGFTKAFFPDAPLLTDDFGVDKLLIKYRGFPGIQKILEIEKERNKDGKVNIERLMSRLDSSMPHDTSLTPDSIQKELLRDLKRVIQERILTSRISIKEEELLEEFARHCVKNAHNIITFNYDDFLDQKLLKSNRSPYIDTGLWSPFTGYGFPCKSITKQSMLEMGLAPGAFSNSYLLKLHGSLNWRIALGAGRPSPLRSIYRSEDWSNTGLSSRDREEAERQLEHDPLIVAPLLNKQQVMNEPVLRLVWKLGYESLQGAEHVVFIGYSFPPTDLASQALFSEALYAKDTTKISVVNKADDKDAEVQLIERYSGLFPSLNREGFCFDGAIEWIRQWMRSMSNPEKVQTDSGKQ